MQKIEILDNREKPDSFCPMCGVKNIEFDGKGSKINECKHLIYLGSDEGTEFDREKLYDKIELSDDSVGDILSKLLNDDYVCFILSEGAPSGLSGYIVYKLNES